MTTITPELILNTAQQVHPDNIYTPTTVAYIQTLLHPYEMALNGATDVTGIYDWIPLAITGELAKHSVAEITKIISAEMLKNVDADGQI